MSDDDFQKNVEARRGFVAMLSHAPLVFEGWVGYACPILLSQSAAGFLSDKRLLRC